MIKIIFVGDKPSSTNVSDKVPFVGAKCFSKLIGWIKVLAPDYYVCYNSHNRENFRAIINIWRNDLDFKIVALGNNASKRLTKWGLDHYRLPHPSPLNRQLNDDEYINTQLIKCKKFLCSSL